MLTSARRTTECRSGSAILSLSIRIRSPLFPTHKRKPFTLPRLQCAETTTFYFKYQPDIKHRIFDIVCGLRLGALPRQQCAYIVAGLGRGRGWNRQDARRCVSCMSILMCLASYLRKCYIVRLLLRVLTPFATFSSVVTERRSSFQRQSGRVGA